MSDRFTDAVTALFDRLATVNGRTVVYRREPDVLTFIAAKGSCLLRVSDRLGGTYVVRTQDDYLFPASALGTLAPPQDGNRIFDSRDDMVYEVMPPAPSEASWRYTDGTRMLMRVHTREVP